MKRRTVLHALPTTSTVSPVSAVQVLVTALLLTLGSQAHMARAGTCAAPSFAPARTFPGAGGCAVSVVVADLNGDGKADLVLGTQDPFDCCTEAVAVLLGNGDGTFQAGVPYPAGVNPASVTIGDFNGDGKADLVTTGRGGTTKVLSVLLGSGGGAFGAPSYFGAGWVPSSLATADFNGDGKPDLAVADYHGGALILLGNGDGSFQPAITNSTGLYPESVAAGELDGDRKPDLAVANAGDGPAFTNGSLSVLIGNGDGTFRPAANYFTGPGPISVAIGDCNGDGKPDILIANYGSGPAFTNGSVSVLLGNGDGTFRPAINTPIVPSPVSVAVADFNGDGNLDVAVSHDSYGTGAPASVSVMLGNGDGTFQSPVSFDVGAFLRDSDRTLAVGDFDGDGRPDIAVASCNGATVFLNTCPSAGIRLDIVCTGGTLALSWPLPYTNFVLESVTDLASSAWQPVAATTTTGRGRCEVMVPLDAVQHFFRLRKP